MTKSGSRPACSSAPTLSTLTPARRRGTEPPAAPPAVRIGKGTCQSPIVHDQLRRALVSERSGAGRSWLYRSRQDLLWTMGGGMSMYETATEYFLLQARYVRRRPLLSF